jgi:hypothetical protein
MSAKIPHIEAFKAMYDRSTLDNTPHSWLEANRTHKRARGRKYHVSNVSWYKRQSSSLRWRQTEICGAEKAIQEEDGIGWQAERCYLGKFQLEFRWEIHWLSK